MNYTGRKQAELQELHMIFDNMSEIMDLDREIADMEGKIQSLPKMTDEDVEKIKKEHPFKAPEYEGPYQEALFKILGPRWNIGFALKPIYLAIYILLGIAVVVWSGIQIFAYNSVVSWEYTIFMELGNNLSIVAAIVSYEIFLIGIWVLGGRIAKWFHW